MDSSFYSSNNSEIQNSQSEEMMEINTPLSSNLKKDFLKQHFENETGVHNYVDIITSPIIFTRIAFSIVFYSSIIYFCIETAKFLGIDSFYFLIPVFISILFCFICLVNCIILRYGLLKRKFITLTKIIFCFSYLTFFSWIGMIFYFTNPDNIAKSDDKIVLIIYYSLPLIITNNYFAIPGNNPYFTLGEMELFIDTTDFINIYFFLLSKEICSYAFYSAYIWLIYFLFLFVNKLFYFFLAKNSKNFSFLWISNCFLTYFSLFLNLATLGVRVYLLYQTNFQDFKTIMFCFKNFIQIHTIIQLISDYNDKKNIFFADFNFLIEKILTGCFRKFKFVFWVFTSIIIHYIVISFIYYIYIQVQMRSFIWYFLGFFSALELFLFITLLKNLKEHNGHFVISSIIIFILNLLFMSCFNIFILYFNSIYLPEKNIFFNTLVLDKSQLIAFYSFLIFFEVIYKSIGINFILNYYNFLRFNLDTNGYSYHAYKFLSNIKKYSTFVFISSCMIFFTCLDSDFSTTYRSFAAILSFVEYTSYHVGYILVTVILYYIDDIYDSKLSICRAVYVYLQLFNCILGLTLRSLKGDFADEFFFYNLYLGLVYLIMYGTAIYTENRRYSSYPMITFLFPKNMPDQNYYI